MLKLGLQEMKRSSVFKGQPLSVLLLGLAVARLFFEVWEVKITGMALCHSIGPFTSWGESKKPAAGTNTPPSSGLNPSSFLKSREGGLKCLESKKTTRESQLGFVEFFLELPVRAITGGSTRRQY